MWLYHLVQQKKVLIYSSYMIFMLLAILSLWRTIEGYSFMELSSLFTPVFYAFLLVTGVLLLFKPAYFVLQYVLAMGSTLLMTTILIELSGWAWTEEIIVAYTLLIAVCTVIILLIFTTQHEEVTQAVGCSIIYSISFFILLLVGQMFTPLLTKLMIILIVGQALAYVLTILFLPLSGIMQDFSKRITGRTVVQKVAIKKKVAKRKVTWMNKENTFQIGEYGRASIVFLLLLYISSVSYSWYFVQQNMEYFQWTVVWIFSLFLLAAFFNSFKSSLMIHGVLLYMGTALAEVLYFAPPEAEIEVIMGVLLFIGIGIHQHVVWVFTGFKNRSSHFLIFGCFLLGLFPLLSGLTVLQSSQWTILTILLGSFIVNILSVIYLPLFRQVLFAVKRRSNRPYHHSYANSTNAPSYEKKEQVNDSYISIGIRERDLTLHYGKWLRKKESKLIEDFSESND
jgi:hypothetical protein